MPKVLKVVDTILRFFERLGALITTAILLVAGTGIAIAYLHGKSVAAWVPVIVGVPLFVLVLVAFAIGIHSGGGGGEGTSLKERELERELEGAVRRTEAAVAAAISDMKRVIAQSEYEKRLLTEALESVQLAIASDDPWDLDALVERGVLGTVRGLLIRKGDEDVRLAVLFPADDPPVHWRMRWAAGHRPESVRNYHHEIDETLAGIAFRRGDYVERGNVRDDPDFRPNPRETRPFKSLVAVPLRVEERIVGAFSVVSTVENAFESTDIAFIKVIGALLDVILAAEHDAGR
jgi:hypothetical protein